MSCIIGITVETGSNWENFYQPYANAVRDYGAESVPITPDLLKNEGLKNLLGSFSGLLFSGGDDVSLQSFLNPFSGDSSTWREMELAMHMEVSEDRDKIEIPLIQKALERNIPILGICRGMQVLNIALGGRLSLDLPSDPVEHRSGPKPQDGSPKPSRFHDIRVLKNSLLENSLNGVHLTRVNSRHHQGITKEYLAPDLIPIAWCPQDGLIEAVQSKKDKWVLGVQWHPERVQDLDVHEACQGIFRHFIKAINS